MTTIFDSRLRSPLRYCPRCDKETLWTRVSGGRLGCDCGLAECDLLTVEEYERHRAHEAAA